MEIKELTCENSGEWEDAGSSLASANSNMRMLTEVRLGACTEGADFASYPVDMQARTPANFLFDKKFVGLGGVAEDVDAWGDTVDGLVGGGADEVATYVVNIDLLSFGGIYKD